MREPRPVPSHNLFRRKDTSDLYCVVPEERPVPPFIRKPAWEFAGKFDYAYPPPGFREGAARTAIHHQGFYAFNSYGNGPSCAVACLVDVLVHPIQTAPHSDWAERGTR
jgi:hypothetical protein